MARLRIIQIRNFRGIACLDWFPSPGLNCLIGRGDSGKTSILDAVDLCVGARRNPIFSDIDFHNLNLENPISITVTLGELPEALRSMEGYGQYLRGFNPTTGAVDDEPGAGLETVLTLNLTVGSDLEPAWSLVSDRAAALGLTRGLAWSDRLQIAPVRIGGSSDLNLAWRRGSVLNRLNDETVDASAALIAAARQARLAFGDQAQTQLAETLATVAAVAAELGIPLQEGVVRALLDAQSVSFSGGTVSLHDKQGVPLRAMGVGSARLLVAGLQRKAAPQAGITLIDELEHGLEPNRVIRLLGSLGAKDADAPLQVFATTHSPVAVRELAAEQLHVIRPYQGRHYVIQANVGDIQGTIRLFPEALLASSVIVCEGASEVGLLRGLDLYRVQNDLGPSLTAQGVALVDAGGVSKLYGRAEAFRQLGYRTLTFRDDDAQPVATDEANFITGGGQVVLWRPGCALEDEMFLGMPANAVQALVERAIEFHGDALIRDQIRTVSGNAFSLDHPAQLLTDPGRRVLAQASKSKQNWFKSVSRMEAVAQEIIGPNLDAATPAYRAIIHALFNWMNG